jgi:flagellar protein FliS
MSTNPYDTYLEATVLSADPTELIRLLYRTAIESVRDARAYLADGEIAARCRAISKAVALLAELGLCLKPDIEPRLARNLTELYDYMRRRLLTANLNQVDAPLAEVVGLLENLLEAWEKIDVPPAREQLELAAAEF